MMGFNSLNPIISVMTLDIVRELLEYSEDSDLLARKFTEKIRELTGAKIVVLIQFPAEGDDFSLLAISPERRKEEVVTAEMRRIFKRAKGIFKTTTWSSIEDMGADYTCLEGSYPSNLVGPLISGNQQIGCLVALGVVEERSVDFLVNVFDVLLGIAALVFKNASLIRDQEATIRLRTRDLTRAKENAERADLAKSEFLANMSHEIRTPLNAVIGFAELLSAMYSEPKQQSYLNAIKTAGTNLLNLINDILDLSKIEAGQLQISHDSANFIKILRDIEQIFTPKIKEKGLQFILQVEKDVPVNINCDEMRLKQVLLNLVGNAVKFTKQGHIKISVSGKYIGDAKDRADLQLSIEDTGIGIPPADLDGIFQSFMQVDGKHNRRHDGTGLGLSICKRLVEAMNGQLTVSSTLDAGSTFLVTLNNVAVISGSEEETVEPQANSGISRLFNKQTVLVVDDDKINRFLLREVLLRRNLEVILAENGQEALDILNSVHPDLILLDIQMPVMDGFEAITRIKENPQTARIPVIALTATMLPEVEINALLRQFNGYLPKPISSDGLTSELAKHMCLVPVQDEIPTDPSH